ncbi:MAG: hypothetical protein AB1571_01225 [Nanoarchaeota archaeon]
MKKINYIFLALTLSILFLSGCAEQQNEIQNIKGITLSPKSFQQDDFKEFFENAKLTGNIITWSGDWNELSNIEKGGPAVVSSLALVYKYTPIIITQFFTQNSGQLLRPLNEDTKQNYKNYLIQFVKKYKPKYIGLGIEVNMLSEKSPQDFNSFVELYNEAYDEIKKASPDTKVFTVFQLEKMKGLNGGLFGGTNNPDKAQWDLLKKFSKSDIIAFTTYPGLIYKNPSEIPQDYYTEIKFYTQKPISFTEIGWYSSNAIQGWESSESEQAEFITTFFSLTKDLNKEFSIWSFMYDQNVIEPFNSMGLITKDGSFKQAWDIWVKS